ncbi:MAG: hypothetical protein AAF533_15600 [Acidobacteriota bacterium]
MIRVRIEPELKVLIETLAEESGLTLPELLRLLADEHLEGVGEERRLRIQEKARARLSPEPPVSRDDAACS